MQRNRTRVASLDAYAALQHLLPPGTDLCLIGEVGTGKCSLICQAAPRGDVPIICTSAEAFWARDRDTVCARPHQFAAFRQAVQGDDVDEQAGELEHLKPCVTTGYRNIDKDGGETVRLLAHGRDFQQVDVLDDDGQPNVLMLQKGAANGAVAAAFVNEILRPMVQFRERLEIDDGWTLAEGEYSKSYKHAGVNIWTAHQQQSSVYALASGRKRLLVAEAKAGQTFEAGLMRTLVESKLGGGRLNNNTVKEIIMVHTGAESCMADDMINSGAADDVINDFACKMLERLGADARAQLHKEVPALVKDWSLHQAPAPPNLLQPHHGARAVAAAGAAGAVGLVGAAGAAAAVGGAAGAVGGAAGVAGAPSCSMDGWDGFIAFKELEVADALLLLK